MPDPRPGSGAPGDPLTRLQIESWRLLWEELARDPSAMAEYRAWEERRLVTFPALRELLDDFLAGAPLDRFRATLGERARTSWDLLGLRGMSGAMWLERLAAGLPDATALAARLRAALRVPRTEDEARARMRGMMDWLQDTVARGEAKRWQLQPGRAPAFLSLWWHVQQPDRWPAYHMTARRALLGEEGGFLPAGDPVEDYLRFRAAFLRLGAAIGRTVWELEYLAAWGPERERGGEPGAFYEPGRLRGGRAVRERPPPAERPAPATHPAATAGSEHARAQWLLATLGARLGCAVWIAANDHARRWGGVALGSLSVRRLPPLGLDADSQRAASLIDVVWLTGAGQVAAAFEVELTTSVYSGLLRMADLAALAPNLNFPLYVVTPEARLGRVRRELQRPTFRALDLHHRVAIIPLERLAAEAEGIVRWGSDPRVVDRLALRAEDLSPLPAPRAKGARRGA